MPDPSREFQVFAKPVGALCNLHCHYCYYLDKEDLYQGRARRMTAELLEKYIIQHIESSTEKIINFSWHGGEPMLAGLDFYREAVRLQSRYCPPDKKIINGIQTNGTLIDEEWISFLARENFTVGISLDGPEDLHNIYRVSQSQEPTYQKVIWGYKLLREYRVPVEILCVVNKHNAEKPKEVFGFFRDLGASYLTFLPLVESIHGQAPNVSDRSVHPNAFGKFLCTIFNEWIEKGIGRIKIQVFEEAARTAFNQDHTLCIFKRTCGGVPVVEHNGDFYSCDHYVNADHYPGNIKNIHLKDLLDSESQKAFGQAKLDTLPQYCLKCEVRSMCNGECPRNRFIHTPDGEPGLNYLCEGYKMFFNHCRPFVEAIASVWKNPDNQS